jgi:SAM-dependent methyltransferase
VGDETSRYPRAGEVALTSGNVDTNASYVFDQAWEEERSRLQGLEAYYDAVTVRWLERTGVGPGWQCLEVGGGAGSIAQWLASKISPTGHLVVTDVDPRFLDGLRSDHVEVRRHDIGHDELEVGAFDLIHIRCVLMHVPSRDDVLERIVDALRPGGWLVIEEPDWGELTARSVERYFSPAHVRAVAMQLDDGTIAASRRAGGDPEFGSQLPGRLIGLGLEEVDAELCSRLVRGGSDRVGFELRSVEFLGPRFVAAGVMADSELDQVKAVLTDPSAFHLGLVPMVSAMGRRPRDI